VCSLSFKIKRERERERERERGVRVRMWGGRQVVMEKRRIKWRRGLIVKVSKVEDVGN
jgi:hypothetical protein